MVTAFVEMYLYLAMVVNGFQYAICNVIIVDNMDEGNYVKGAQHVVKRFSLKSETKNTVII